MQVPSVCDNGHGLAFHDIVPVTIWCLQSQAKYPSAIPDKRCLFVGSPYSVYLLQASTRAVSSLCNDVAQQPLTYVQIIFDGVLSVSPCSVSLSFIIFIHWNFLSDHNDSHFISLPSLRPSLNYGAYSSLSIPPGFLGLCCAFQHTRTHLSFFTGRHSNFLNQFAKS